MPRVMEIVTPLGDDVLLFHGMQAREELSRLGEYRLDLLSPKGDISLDEILGKNVTVKLALPDDSTRFFNGYVTTFSQVGMHGRYHRYTAVVRPWLWFLTRTADCRIFQEMTVPDIVKAVLSDHESADFVLELTGHYRQWTYCVQYRETDFNFVSRLLEHEGLYYYVRHTDGHNTLVITDSTGKHTASPGYEEIPFVAPGQRVRPELEHIQSWDLTREIQPGVYVHDDYDLERPSVELKTSKTLSRGYTPSDYEVFDYPGLYVKKPDGEQYADVRIDEYGSQFEVTHAATNSKGVRVGSLFTLQDFPRADQNREHLVVAASYDLEYAGYEGLPRGGGTHSRCTFTAMSSAQQFRPRRATPKPFVQGPQTAVVTGPSGDEIHTDKYGRVTVQFHWDRYGKKNENSSCWIRVSHPWAGKGWGSVATPRIGQEVIVDFLEGDPDQPIITGRVYNAECQPPFGFPAGAVISGIKSRTHKGSGYNEISADDTAGKEKVNIHAQYDMTTRVEHDESLSVGGDRSVTVTGNQSVTISGKGQSPVHSTVSVTGKHSLVASDTIYIKAPTSITLECPGSKIEMLPGKITITAGGGAKIVLDANALTQSSAGAKVLLDSNVLAQSVPGAKVVLDANALTQSSAGAKVLLDGNVLAQAVAGSNLLLDANATLTGVAKAAVNGAAEATLTAGGKVKASPGGVEVVGAMVKLNS